MGSENLGGLLWLLVVGGLFYWMMRRGGCGMHAGHGHHSDHRHGADPAIGDGEGSMDRAPVAESARDPVCGMSLEPADAAGVRTVAGVIYYLCSPSCLEKFDRNSESYARRAAEAASASAGSHHGHRHSGC